MGILDALARRFMALRSRAPRFELNPAGFRQSLMTLLLRLPPPWRRASRSRRATRSSSRRGITPLPRRVSIWRLTRHWRYNRAAGRRLTLISNRCGIAARARCERFLGRYAGSIFFEKSPQLRREHAVRLYRVKQGFGETIHNRPSGGSLSSCRIPIATGCSIALAWGHHASPACDSHLR